MNLSLKSIAAFSALSAIAIAPLLSAGSASAQPRKGFSDSYVGAGVAAGVTNGGQNNDAATFGGTIDGRFALRKAPVSLRGSVIYSDDTSAIIPMITYDKGITKNTQVYGGVGYSFVEANGQPTPVGNDDAVILTAGVESKVTKDVVLYGNTKWGINAYQNGPADSLSFQAGAGLRF